MIELPAGLIRGEVLRDEPLSRHTSLKVGGPADLFVSPVDADDLQTLLGHLLDRRIPYVIVGGGYNLLVRDGGFRGAAISLKKLSDITVDGTGVAVQAGAANSRLVEKAVVAGLSGLEFLACIPGTVGGALAMNAGAHGGAIADFAESVTLVSPSGIRQVFRDKLSFGYRRFDVPQGEVIAAAVLALSPAPRSEIERRIAEYREHRRQSQNVGFPSAGSFFKNPTEAPAWRLIDEAGFRGRRIGGAQVSENHCNFFVNRGGAKAADFLALAEEVKAEVARRTGIILEEEVKILGEDQ